MRKVQAQPPPDLDEEGALQTILEGTAAGTGDGFFKAMAQNLARALKAHGAWITEYLPESRTLRALAYFMGGEWVDDHEFALEGTPCGAVIENSAFIHFPDRLAEQFPHDPHVKGSGIVSYMGVPLLDTDGGILGHMAVVDKRPMLKQPKVLAIFRIFAARAAADLRRLRAEREVQEQEQRCRRLVDNAMDAIVELDAQMRSRTVNPAAARLFGCASADAVGPDLSRHFTDAGRDTLRRMMRDLDSLPGDRRDLSVAGAMEARRADGHAFTAEATLFRSDSGRLPSYTLFLRDNGDRLETERKLKGLAAESDRIKELLRSLQRSEDIIGRSEPMQAAMRVVQRAAETDGPVLIQGEIGTGKALVARSIHARSRRRDRPFLRLNCAEASASQIEGELIGAVILAEGGSIFLEEIASLPASLQAKLFRLLQEGEVEPPGAARPRKVDVRVLAATGQDLERAVAEARFRRDLCDKLYAFTLRLPPLRERSGDIPLLAASFAQRFAARIGRVVQPLTEEDLGRLAACNWPGNVQELRSLVERAVMNAAEGRIDLDRVLPRPPQPVVEAAPVDEGPPKVLTVEDLMQLEYDNILRALEVSGGEVAGVNGAAQLLGVKPATITARMKALGIATTPAAPTRRSAPAKPRRPASRAR